MAGIFYYVSGHGFGHAVRSAQVLAALRSRSPDLSIWVRTTAPSRLFPEGSIVEPVTLDLGVLQRGSLHIRRRETLAQYARFIQTESARLEAEIALARDRRISCIVSDIASGPFDIAARLGIPGLGVANFCWHWIYEPYARRFPALAHVVRHIRDQESRATQLLRLPFSWDFDCFPSVKDVPLIGRKAIRSRDAVRARLGIDADRRVALLSFGGFGLEQLGASALTRWREWLFVTTDDARPAGTVANVLNVTDAGLPYVDLLAAADAVITKPGFGIVSDALVNRIPVLYSDRGEFREYGVLAHALRTLGRAKFIPRRELVDGNLGPYLDALCEIRTPWTDLTADGADVIAARILEHAE